MTFEEVLITCKMKCTECQEIFRNLCDKENCVTEVVRKIIEKQIPKKPIHKTVTNDIQGFPYEDADVRCPFCGNRFYSIIGGEIVAGKKTNYCSKCGQRLDWSDVE